MKTTICIGVSEWPILRDGSEIEVGTDTTEISCGDLAIFSKRGIKRCHRVLYKKRTERRNWYFIKGDTVFRSDGWIPEENLIGKIASKPWLTLFSPAFLFHGRFQVRSRRLLISTGFLIFGKKKKGPVSEGVLSLGWCLSYVLTTPWGLLNRQIRGQVLKQVRRDAGRIIFNSLITPPRQAGIRMKYHGGDYGHGYFYEEIFAKHDNDSERIVQLIARSPGRVLDLAGGAGRLAAGLALESIPVTLLDSSESMLNHARKRQKNLPNSKKPLMKICKMRLETLSQPNPFDYAISLRNGLAHLSDERSVVHCLMRIKECLTSKGIFYMEVHNPNFWIWQRGWGKNRWQYQNDIWIEEKKYRLWERTRVEETSRIRWEHAISSNFLSYVHLSSVILFFSPEKWTALINEASLNVIDTYNDWDLQSPPNRSSGRAIFKIVRA